MGPYYTVRTNCKLASFSYRATVTNMYDSPRVVYSTYVREPINHIKNNSQEKNSSSDALLAIQTLGQLFSLLLSALCL